MVFFYFGGIICLGLYFSKFIKSPRDYFLAGRMLPFWAIGMSIVATDIGAVDFVGLTGQAYRYGIVVGNFDWIGSVPAMILAATVFIPYYWRAGVFTIPEYLGRRYNSYVQTLHAVVWIVFMVFSLGVTLWASGVLLSELMGWSINTAILIAAVIVGLYTISGGLLAVVMTDVVQLSIMFVGAMAILALGLWDLGGWNGMIDTIQNMGQEYSYHLSLIVPANADTPYPWTGILFGLALVMAPAYFIANQAIVQRSLGAKNEWSAKAGLLFGALLKMFIPVLVVIPGLIALALYPGQMDGDRVFPLMIKNLLPPGLTGLVFAGFFAGLMSTMDSGLNSVATIWTKDIYEKYIKKRAEERHYLLMGRLFTAIILLFAVLSAPLTSYFPGIYVYIQTLLSFIQGPTLAVLVLGMFWHRSTQWGGLAGLLGGLCLSAAMFAFKGRLFTISDPFLYISWWSFLGASVLCVLTSLVTAPEPEDKLRGLVYKQITGDEEVQSILRNQLER